MPTDPIKALILCTGNSCRSIMAEVFLNEPGQGRFQARSTGSFPTGYVHPRSIETLRRHGIDPGQPYSKSWSEFSAQPLDLVITVCDQAAGETCPIFPGQPTKLQWGTPDPVKVLENEADPQAAFDRAFHFLKERKSSWLRPQSAQNRSRVHSTQGCGFIGGSPARVPDRVFS